MTTQIATGDGDTVTTLFAERQRFEGWLSALEARRADTPPHIYERVKTDYQDRLRGVMEQLRAQRATVEARASSLNNRVGELESEARTHEDERAEIELRAANGCWYRLRAFRLRPASRRTDPRHHGTGERCGHPTERRGHSRDAASRPGRRFAGIGTVRWRCPGDRQGCGAARGWHGHLPGLALRSRCR
jgi:hypothetical protein